MQGRVQTSALPDRQMHRCRGGRLQASAASLHHPKTRSPSAQGLSKQKRTPWHNPCCTLVYALAEHIKHQHGVVGRQCAAALAHDGGRFDAPLDAHLLRKQQQPW